MRWGLIIFANCGNKQTLIYSYATPQITQEATTMKQNVTEYMFKDEFRKIRPNAFSWGGLSALYDYFMEYEDSVGEELEFDAIAICCDYCEYENYEEIKESYDVGGLDDDEIKEWLSSHTDYIEHDEGIIIRNF